MVFLRMCTNVKDESDKTEGNVESTRLSDMLHVSPCGMTCLPHASSNRFGLADLFVCLPRTGQTPKKGPRPI